MIAFAIGAVFLLPIGAVFGELTAAIPISGGIIEYVDRTYGRNVSYITGWFLALGNGILCPWEAIAISTLDVYKRQALMRTRGRRQQALTCKPEAA